MEWQPYSTVPKNPDIHVMLWDKYEKTPAIARWTKYGWAADTTYLGIDGDATFADKIDEQYLTHWMPLPNPPKETTS